MNNFRSQNGGISILGTIILALIIIGVLSYFDISLKSFIESDKFQENISYVGGVVKDIWNDYLKKPATFIWEELILKLINSIRDSSGSLDLNKMSPGLPQ